MIKFNELQLNEDKLLMVTKISEPSRNQKMEFVTEDIDPFIEIRQENNPKQWILAHLLYQSNKYIVVLILLGTLFTSILNSSLLVIIGYAIDDFTLGISKNFFMYIVLIGLLGIGNPILNLTINLIRETLAQRMEKDTRHEFYTNLLGKSQSFHDQQRIGDIMARTTNDVRMLNFLVSPALSLIFQSFTGLIIPILFIAFFYSIPVTNNFSVVPSILLSHQLLLAPLLFTLLFVFSLRGYSRKLNPVTAKLREEFGKMNAILNESLCIQVDSRD